MKKTFSESIGRFLTVYRKEILDHRRDRRSIFVILIYPVFAPVLIGILVLFMSTIAPQNTDSPVKIGVIGLDQLRDSSQESLFQDIFHQVGITLDPLLLQPASQQDSIPLKNSSVIVVIKQGTYLYDFTVVYNRYNQESARVAALVEVQLYKYRERRLLESSKEDGITLTPIEKVHVGEPQNLNKVLLRLIPMLLIFTLFYGSVHVVIDATVGERERRSWENLRTSPLRVWELLFGKGLAAMSFSMLALLIQIFVFLVILNGLLTEYITPSIPLSLWGVLFLLCIPLLFMSVSLQVLIGVVSRTSKEAHLYAGLLPLLPVFMSLSIAFSSSSEVGGGIGEVVPFVGQLFLLQQLFDQFTLGLGQTVFVSVTTLLMSFCIFLLTVFMASKTQTY